MSDLIDRQAAIDKISEYASIWVSCTDSMTKDQIAQEALNSAKATMIRIVKELPSAQPERKKGKWSFIGDNMFECTCCGTPYTTQQLNGLRNYNTDPYAPNFCPNCGADMRGEQDG